VVGFMLVFEILLRIQKQINRKGPKVAQSFYYIKLCAISLRPLRLCGLLIEQTPTLNSLQELTLHAQN
jgi:hypothetical protein